LNLINSNQDLNLHLYKHPFTQSELFFTITFYEKTGKTVNEKYISMCYLNEGTLHYFNTPENVLFEQIHKETFEEALEKLQTQEK